MIAETEILMKYLPPSLGIFLVVVAAGLMGLFRSMALNKKSYDDTVECLQRQIQVLKEENVLLRERIVVKEEALKNIEMESLEEKEKE